MVTAGKKTNMFFLLLSLNFQWAKRQPFLMNSNKILYKWNLPLSTLRAEVSLVFLDQSRKIVETSARRVSFMSKASIFTPHPLHTFQFQFSILAFAFVLVSFSYSPITIILPNNLRSLREISNQYCIFFFQ